MWKGCFIVRLFWNTLKCASTVLECSCCRIHRYVAAPQVHMTKIHKSTNSCLKYTIRMVCKFMDRLWCVHTEHTVYIRCCYITVDSATTALQNGAFTYRCISKQLHYKTHFSHNCCMKFYENYTTLFCMEKIFFDIIILTQNHTWHITQSDYLV